MNTRILYQDVRLNMNTRILYHDVNYENEIYTKEYFDGITYIKFFYVFDKEENNE